MSVVPFARQLTAVASPVVFSDTVVNGDAQLPEWFEMPAGGSITFKDGTGTSRTFSDVPAGKAYAIQLREITSSTAIVRVGTNPLNAMAPSAPTAIAASQLGAPDAYGFAVDLTLRVAFTAATTGSADDVTILASAPFGFRILDAMLYVSTAKGSATVTLRSATGGGGSALSDDLSVNATGVVRNASLTASPTVAAAGALYLRRSDRACAGELILRCIKT